MAGYGARLAACASALGFAGLLGVLAAVGGISGAEAAWWSVAATAGLAPAGLASPVGWRRRAAESALLPAALAVVFVSSPPMRLMVAPPLLGLAALAALAAAASRLPVGRHPALAAACGLAAAAAVGPGLVASPWWAAGLAFAAAAALPWGATRLAGVGAGGATAVALTAAPLVGHPVAAGVVVVVAVLLGRRRREVPAPALPPWLPAAVAVGALGLALGSWGGLAPAQALPGAAWGVLVAAATTLLVAGRWLPAGLAGAGWLAVTLALGPVQPPPPDRGAFRLETGAAEAVLPAADGGDCRLDLSLVGGAALADGSSAAVLETSAGSRVLTVGRDVAARRAGLGGAEHGLPDLPVWRPAGLDAAAGWRVAGRIAVEVPAGETPRLRRHPSLPDGVTVVVETCGPARPTPPRDRALGWWLAAAAAAVALLQLSGGSWRRPVALLPWSLLTVASLAGRVAVEPLRLVLERHAVDLALAALLTAWLPVAWRWLVSGRAGRAAFALLLPLALATPHLTPPMYGDEPFHLLLMESMTADRDLELANQVEAADPNQAPYLRGRPLLHSPVLALLLLPGFAVAGRAGALALLAVAGAWLVALVDRRAADFGLGRRRRALLALAVLTTYPLATFATQVWPEVVGALALAVGLVAAARSRAVAATLAAVVAVAVKTRLGLLSFPVAASSFLGGARRRPVAAAVVLAAAAAASLAVGWATMGHPFGYYRRLGHLLELEPGRIVTVLGGLLLDPAGGLAFSAPLWLLALAGLVALWRRGGHGERAAILGGALTLAALLHSVEWYGGGSPPARYLVPLLPAVALAGAALLARASGWRRLGEALIAPSVVLWWVLLSRPHYSVNPGDGTSWLEGALARRFLADAHSLLPSFLAPSPATLVAPAILAVVGGLAIWVARRPQRVRRVVALASAGWLLAGAGFVAVLTLRTDRLVEAEAPQVRRHGGRPEPPEGATSRFLRPCGWLLGRGEAMTVPLNLPPGAEVRLEGWFVGRARSEGGQLRVQWDDGAPELLPLGAADPAGRVLLPAPPGEGRRRLRLEHRGPGGLVVDRLVVTP